MPIIDAVRLFFDPRVGWEAINNRRYSLFGVVLGHTLLFALLPVTAGYYGTSQVGWQIGAGDVVRLTTESAGKIAVMYYAALVVAVGSVAWMTRWMSTTYGAEQPLAQCFALATFTATPLFLVGLLQAYPILWLNFILGLPALAYTAYLFFSGVPIMMGISQERGFLFACAVLAFGLVTLVAMMAVTVVLWGAGFAPAFTS